MAMRSESNTGVDGLSKLGSRMPKRMLWTDSTGKELEVNLAALLKPPADIESPEEVRASIKRVAASYAFWAYQAIRSKEAAAKQDLAYREKHAMQSVALRSRIDTDTSFDSSKYKVLDDFMDFHKPAVKLKRRRQRFQQRAEFAAMIRDTLKAMLSAMQSVLYSLRESDRTADRD